MYVYKNMHAFFLHKLTFVKLEHVCTVEEISLPMLSQFSCTSSELEKIQFSREIFGKKNQLLFVPSIDFFYSYNSADMQVFLAATHIIQKKTAAYKC